MSGRSEGVIRPFAEPSMNNHVQIQFPDHSKTLIMSNGIAKELAEEMLEHATRNDDG